jgi:hypothetical protein
VTETNYRNFRDVVWEAMENFGIRSYFDESFRAVEIDLVTNKNPYRLIQVIRNCLLVIYIPGGSKTNCGRHTGRFHINNHHNSR